MKKIYGLYLQGFLILTSIGFEFISLSLQLLTNRKVFLYFTLMFMVVAQIFIFMDERRFR